MTYKKGWIKDKPDDRDFQYTPADDNAQLPASVDLRDLCPPVYTQGNYNTCTGHAISSAFEFELKKLGLPDFSPSRLFIYYNERLIEGNTGLDSGAQIRTGMKVVNTVGVCHETLWPYEVSDITIKPGDDCYQAALNNTVTQYLALTNDLTQLKTCLAGGNPFVFGMMMFSSFESAEVANTGRVPMPVAGEAQMGGHAVMAVGYNDADQHFIVRNSWGPGWGDQGYFYLPYEFVSNSNYVTDFWVIQVVK